MRELSAISLVASAALAMGGCGSGTSSTSSTPASTTTPRCRTYEAARELRKLRADVASVRRAARRPTKNPLKGNPAVSGATDRFLADLGSAHLDLLLENRLIDHAAAALAGSCTQCFQALEAERPIPAISHGGRCG